MDNQSCGDFCRRLKALLDGASRLLPKLRLQTRASSADGSNDGLESEILDFLSVGGYAAEAELLKCLRAPAKAFYASVEGLMGKGLVERFRSPTNRNIIFLELTRDGSDAAKQAERQCGKMLFGAFARGFSHADRLEATAALEKASQILNKLAYSDMSPLPEKIKGTTTASDTGRFRKRKRKDKKAR